MATTTKTVKKSPTTRKTTPPKQTAKIVSKPKTYTGKVWDRTAPYRVNSWLFAYVLVAIGAPQITLLWRPMVGTYVTVASLAALIILAAKSPKARTVAISAAILPLVTMVNLCLPQTGTFAQMVVFYDSLLLLALVYRFMFTLDEPVENTQLTARGYAFALPLMIVIGQVLGVIGYFMLRNHYDYKAISLPLVAAASVVFAFAEETFFRGLLQQRAARVLHPAVATLLSIVAYSLTSVGTSTILPAVMALLSGSVLSLTYYKKQNLILTTTINATTKLVFIGLLATFVLK